MQCVDCEWMGALEDSDGDTVYFCMQKDSPAYLDVTGLLGNCSWDGYERLEPLYHVTSRSYTGDIRRAGLRSPVAVFADRDEMELALQNEFGDQLSKRWGKNAPLAILEIHLPDSWLGDLDYIGAGEREIRRDIPPDYIAFFDKAMEELEEEGFV